MILFDPLLEAPLPEEISYRPSVVGWQWKISETFESPCFTICW